MDTPNTSFNQPPAGGSNYRQNVMYALAAVGFIVLVSLGVWAAIYASRYMPNVASRVGTAAVYVGSLFQSPAPTNNLTVVGSSTPTSISFGGLPTSPVTPAPTPSPTSAATRGVETSETSQISGGITATPTLYGKPDLSIVITAFGYLTEASTDSFVASSSVPTGARPAVKFTVMNIGTNTSGSWRFDAIIPTRTAYTYHSSVQQSLNPGESIDYTLGFDRAQSGSSEKITITVDPDNTFSESTRDNNSISANLHIL